MNFFKNLFKPKYRIVAAQYKNKPLYYIIQHRVLGSWFGVEDDYLMCVEQFPTYIEAKKRLDEIIASNNINYKTIYES